MAVAPCPVIPKGHSSSWIIIEERHVGSAASEGRVLEHAWKCQRGRLEEVRKVRAFYFSWLRV